MKSLLSYHVNKLIKTNVLNEHKDIACYGRYVIPSGLMLSYSYPASLVNQNEIPIEFSF